MQLRVSAEINFSSEPNALFIASEDHGLNKSRTWHQRSTVIAPAEAICNGPINEEGLSDDVARREISPTAGIQTVHGVVPHDHEMLRLHVERGRGIGKQRGQGQIHLWVVFL